MIRVLSVSHYPVFGGPHNRNMRLAPALEKSGAHLVMLLPEGPGTAAAILQGSGVDVVQIPLGRLRATRDLRIHLRTLARFGGEVHAIRRLIRKERIDVVQLNGLANPHAALAARKESTPVVWQILDTYTPPLIRYAMAPLLRRYADVVMSTGMRVAEMHPGALMGMDRLVTFYPPVDTHLFKRDLMARVAMRKEIGIPDTSLVVGTIGNMNLQKGHDNFIRAAAYLKSTVKDVRFLILGQGPKAHSKYIEDLWRLAAALGLRRGEDIVQVDPTGKVHRIAQVMDVFWMTSRSRSEGIPTAMEEAMALELPVVSFDVGSIQELVQDGVSGFLIADQSPERLAELTAIHLLDPRTRVRIGQAGRRFVEEHATVEICAEQHMSAYRVAMERASKRRAQIG